jgi:hypothetical protein
MLPSARTSFGARPTIALRDGVLVNAFRLALDTYLAAALNWRVLPKVAVEPILCALVLLIFTFAFEALLGIQETVTAEANRHALGIVTAFELTKSIVIWLAAAPVMTHWCRHLLGRRDTTWSKLGLATCSVLPAWFLSGALLLLAAVAVSIARQLGEAWQSSDSGGVLFPAAPELLVAILMIWCWLSARLFVVMALRATMTPNAWRVAGAAMRGRRLSFVGGLWLAVVPPVLLFHASDLTGGDLTEIGAAALLALMAGATASTLVRQRVQAKPAVALPASVSTP